MIVCIPSGGEAVKRHNVRTARFFLDRGIIFWQTRHKSRISRGKTVFPDGFSGIIKLLSDYSFLRFSYSQSTCNFTSIRQNAYFDIFNTQNGASMKCPHCDKSVKGHAGGTKTFRELTPTQQRAAIAKTARDLKEMREIYNASPENSESPA